jgi:rhodanese-related sulfurtransferase
MAKFTRKFWPDLTNQQTTKKLTVIVLKISMKKQTVLNLLTGAIVLIGIAGRAADADGNWSWTTPGRGGAPRESVLSLKTDGATLTGQISTPGRDGKPVDTQITDGKVEGNTISFAVLRIFNDTTNKTSYTGTVAGGQITGKIETIRNGEAQSRDWLAKNAGSQTEAAAVEIVQPKPGYDAAGHKIVNETHYKEISVADAVQFLADHPDAIIIDARSPEEYAAGHLPNAKNYNLTDDATYKDVLATITDKTKWYVVHSAVGHYRTVRALEYFEANNFEHAVAIDGGYAAWVKAGQPTVK